MTKREPVPEAGEPVANAWTCARCEVTVSFSPEVDRPRLPATWVQEDGELYCLGCRREMAGEAGLAEIGEDTPSHERIKVRSQARIEFEIRRDPDRPDNRIAKSCGTSTVAVRKARVRLGLSSPDPVSGAV
ncbi:MAG TPA: hypothetical protein VLB79_13485 [Solirubrobacterales bacterium]|nr:hypothetical protein [Solirubrobacterales bacterium]